MRNFVWLPKKKMMTPDSVSSGQMQGSIHIDQMNQNCRNLEVEAAVEKDASESAAPLKMKYLPQLDGLRALAVLAVVVFHARTTLLPGGYIGVDVFFVLSGFLITQIISAEIMRSGAFSFKNFYLRRALRLFPALFLVASVWALIYWLVPGIPQAHESLVGTAAAITYSSSWIAANHAADLGSMLPTWSLSVEEHFYLVWPILLVLGFKLPKQWRWVAFTMLGLVLVYPVIMFLTAGWSQDRLYYAPDTRAGQLLVGCAAALLLNRMQVKIPSVVALGSAVVLVGFAFVDGRIPVNVYSRGGIILIPLLGLVIVVWAAQRTRGVVHRFLSSKPIVWVGQRSYGIYLWNLPLIGALAFLGSSPGALAAKAVLCLAVPAASYAWMEKPCLKLKDRFYTKAERKAPSAAAENS